jgi:hypothetical protein
MSFLIGLGIVIGLVVFLYLVCVVSTLCQLAFIYMPYSYFKHGELFSDEFTKELCLVEDENKVVVAIFEIVTTYVILISVLNTVGWLLL